MPQPAQKAGNDDVSLGLVGRGAVAEGRRRRGNHQDVVAHDVTIVTAPFDGLFGRTFAFADPDGYAVTLHN